MLIRITSSRNMGKLSSGNGRFNVPTCWNTVYHFKGFEPHILILRGDGLVLKINLHGIYQEHSTSQICYGLAYLDIFPWSMLIES